MSEIGLRVVVTAEKPEAPIEKELPGLGLLVLATLAGMCKRRGLDPFAYLRNTFQCISSLTQGPQPENLTQKSGSQNEGALC